VVFLRRFAWTNGFTSSSSPFRLRCGGAASLVLLGEMGAKTLLAFRLSWVGGAAATLARLEAHRVFTFLPGSAPSDFFESIQQGIL
jgi:hypothetical protein